VRCLTCSGCVNTRGVTQNFIAGLLKIIYRCYARLLLFILAVLSFLLVLANFVNPYFPPSKFDQ